MATAGAKAPQAKKRHEGNEQEYLYPRRTEGQEIQERTKSTMNKNIPYLQLLDPVPDAEQARKQEKIHRSIREANRRIKDLEAEREDLSGNERGAVTREITAETQMRDNLQAMVTLPAPMSREEGIKPFVMFLRAKLQSYRTHKDYFDRRAERSLADAIAQAGEDLMRGEHLLGYSLRVFTGKEHYPVIAEAEQAIDDYEQTGCPIQTVARINYFLRGVIKDIRVRTFTSSNRMRNVEEECNQLAKFDLYDDLHKWQGSTFELHASAYMVTLAAGDVLQTTRDEDGNLLLYRTDFGEQEITVVTGNIRNFEDFDIVLGTRLYIYW